MSGCAVVATPAESKPTYQLEPSLRRLYVTDWKARIGLPTVMLPALFTGAGKSAGSKKMLAVKRRPCLPEPSVQFVSAPVAGSVVREAANQLSSRRAVGSPS